MNGAERRAQRADDGKRAPGRKPGPNAMRDTSSPTKHEGQKIRNEEIAITRVLVCDWDSHLLSFWWKTITFPEGRYPLVQHSRIPMECSTLFAQDDILRNSKTVRIFFGSKTPYGPCFLGGSRPLNWNLLTNEFCHGMRLPRECSIQRRSRLDGTESRSDIKKSYVLVMVRP